MPSQKKKKIRLIYGYVLFFSVRERIKTFGVECLSPIYYLRLYAMSFLFLNFVKNYCFAISIILVFRGDKVENSHQKVRVGAIQIKGRDECIIS